MSSREQFEAAYAADMQSRGKPVTEVAFWRQLEGDYALPIVERAWWAWEASRQSLSVTLPSRSDIKYMEYFPDVEGGIFNERAYLSDFLAAIEAAGVRVNP